MAGRAKLGRTVARLAVAAVAVAGLAAGAQPALGTYIVSRSTTAPSLEVDSVGRAVVSYGEGGQTKHVMVWGAVNALPPKAGGTQVEFKVDYSGGDKTMKNVCSKAKYDGPALPLVVFACKAPDGSYWALQRWQRMLPNLGFAPWRPDQSAMELHVSHWKGALPQLKVVTDWVWGGQYQQIVGTFVYDGKAVYGFKATPGGSPLDSWGRNVYLDTNGSAYGAGWKRENSFLAQGSNGRFCYSLGPRPPYPGYPASGPRTGTGTMYRLTALGPGVTPIVSVDVPSPGAWDPNDPAKVTQENDANALIDSLGFTPAQCHH